MFNLIPRAPKNEFTALGAGSVGRLVGSSQKVVSLIGFETQLSLSDDLREAVEWMRG